MLSAISFGVLRRSAPSTSAIIRSRNDCPGSCVTSTTSRSESSFVPPVTAERSPPASRITGADSPVIADSSTEPTPSITSPSAGMTSPASTTTTSPRCSSGAGILAARRAAGASVVVARRAQRVRLRLAAALGDRLGEVREQHGQPEPDGDHADEPELAVCPRARSRTKIDGRDHAAELDDEHDRVLRPGCAGRASGTSRGSRRRRARGEKMLADWRAIYALCSLSSARLSSRTFTPGSPKKPERATVGVLRRSAAARSRAAGAGRRRRGATGARAYAGEMSGSMPERRGRDRVDRDVADRQARVVRPLELQDRLRRPPGRSSRGRGSSGRGSRTSSRRRCRRASVADGRSWKYRGARELLRGELRADDLAVHARSGCRSPCPGRRPGRSRSSAAG